MRITEWLLCAGLLLGAGACSGGRGGGAELACTSTDAHAVVAEIVKEQLEDLTAAELKKAGGGARIASRSEIRASAAQVQVAVLDVRTAKDDPNSTKRFCTANLRLALAPSVLDDAERVLQLTANESLTDYAENRDIEREANAFQADIEYNVQATDDGQKVYAEIENDSGLLAMVAELLSAHLARSELEGAQIAQEQAAAEMAAAEQAALMEQRNAGFAEAKAELTLAEQRINAAWRSIPSDARNQLLTAQRAWIRRKGADCRLEAAGASIDATEREISRMRCETRLTNERTGGLMPYVRAGYEPEAVEPAEYAGTTTTPQ